MDWRTERAAWIERAASGPLLAIGTLCVSMLLLLALLVLAARNRRLRLQLAGQGGSGKGTSGTVDAPSAGPQAEAIRTPIDRVLPRHPLASHPVALVLARAC